MRRLQRSWLKKEYKKGLETDSQKQETNGQQEEIHKSVLLDEVMGFLLPRDSCVYVDATVGSGGHAEKILEKSSPGGRLIGLDIDPAILKIAKARLERFGKRCNLAESNYTKVTDVIKNFGVEKVDGIIFDLGVNLRHFLDADRGFSFTKDGPLDMRLSPKTEITAAEIINKWDEKELINILYRYGEERFAKNIVKAILENRKKKSISTTGELSGLVMEVLGKGRSGKIHPATRTFQALRIAVNDELLNLETVLPEAVDILNKGGRICVISFHSLEDKLVKNSFRFLANGCICPPEVGECRCGKKPSIKIVTKKPVMPSDKEISFNPRARSAKLRVAEKI
jgi:16S rRNA (cytosine1402-N4)-methyltransferase